MNQKKNDICQVLLFFSHDRHVNQSALCHFPCNFLYSPLSWSQRSLSRIPAVYSTSPLCLHSPQSPAPPLLSPSPSLHHSFLLPLSISHPHISWLILIPSRVFLLPTSFPVALLIAACCAARTLHSSCAHSSLLYPLSLFLTHLCRSLSHIISLFTHSGTPDSCTFATQLQCSLHMPSVHKIFLGLLKYSFYCFNLIFLSTSFKCSLSGGRCTYSIFFQLINISFN